MAKTKGLRFPESKVPKTKVFEKYRSFELHRLFKYPLKAKKVIRSLSESTVVFCFLCLKFGLDFSLDPNEQGTPGSSLRFEMPFDELDVSPVAPRYHACGCYGILPLASESKRLPGSRRALRTREVNVKWIPLSIHNAYPRIMAKPWSRQDLENKDSDS